MYEHAVSAAGSSAVTGQPLLEQIFTIQRRVKGLRSAQQSKWYRGSIIQAFVFAGFCRDESFFLFNFRPLLLTAQKGVFIMNSLVILLIACLLPDRPRRTGRCHLHPQACQHSRREGRSLILLKQKSFPKRKMRQMAASCAFLIFFVSVPDVLT